MPLPTGLSRDEKSGIFHLRIGVPEDIRPYWPKLPNGKMAVDAYRRSLQTRDRPHAISKTLELLADYQQRFAALRARHRPQFTQLTPKLASYLEDQIKHSLLHGDDIRRVVGRVLDGVPMDLAAELPEGLDNAERLQLWAKVVKKLQADGQYGLTIGFLNSLLQSIGLPPVIWTQEPVALARLGRVLATTYAQLAERAAGEVIETPNAPASHAPEATPALAEATKEAPTLTLRDVVPHWTLLTKAKPNAIQRTEYALSLWESAVGSVPLDKITRATGGEFVLYLLDEDREIKRKTAKNHADAINALVNKAVDQGLMDLNPLRMKIDTEDSENRSPWTHEQLKALHEKPITGKQSDGVDPADADLLVSMMLWSGARISEIAGLRLQDIQERDGILAAYIRRETTKNKESVRWLPIAKALRNRVSGHAERLREAGEFFLFPSFNSREKTAAGDHAIKWFKEHRDKLSLPPGALEGSHKWRHTVRTKLSAQGLGEALLDAVTGHKAAGGSAGRKNYDHPDKYPLANVLDAIEKLAWPWPSSSDTMLKAA